MSQVTFRLTLCIPYAFLMTSAVSCISIGMNQNMGKDVGTIEQYFLFVTAINKH